MIFDWWKRRTGTAPARQFYLLAGLFAIMAAGIGAAGFSFYRNQRDSIVAQFAESLSAIADSKVSRIVTWRHDRIGDADLVFSNPLVARGIRQLLAGAQADRELAGWLRSLSQRSEYVSAVVLDRQLKVRWSFLPGETRVGAHATALARDALRTRRLLLSDLHRAEVFNGIHMDLIVPLPGTDPKSEPVGVVLLRIDPYHTLYPMLQSWPMPSRSGEALLVRREGNEVVYLSEARNREKSSLAFRLPLSQTSRPAVLAALGYSGVVEGRDYRGVPVLAVIRQAPDSPWALVVKIDSEEIRAPIRERASYLAALVGLLILAVGATIGLLWRHQRARFYREQYESELRRKEAEEALRSRDLEFKAVFEAALDAMFILDAGLRYLDVNPAGCKLLNHPREEILGKPWGSFSDPVWGPGFLRTLRENQARREIRGVTRYLRADGVSLDLDYAIARDFLPGRHLAIARDITQQVHLEEELRQAQKMDAIGRLAGGIAHDFNNLLTVVSGRVELLLSTLPEWDSARSNVAEIGKAAERAAALTRQLLAFSRKQFLQPRIVDLNALIVDTGKLLQPLVRENIEMVTALETRLEKVRLDPGQFTQVLMNLVINACDAMPQGGRIVIKTANLNLDHARGKKRVDLPPGAYAVVVVSDTGTGMEPAVLERIFEPFYSTKEPGKGTGLGLSMVYGIVKQSGGEISVTSVPGAGTTFTLYFPRAAGV